MNIDTSSLKLANGLKLLGLPWSMVVPYIGRLPNGVTFAIFHPDPLDSYGDFRCVFGAYDGSVAEVGIKNVTRYRDGGTTDIETVVGTFHFPSPFSKNDKPTFCGEVIKVEDR